MDPFVHPQGICESPNVGKGTRIWAYAHVLPSAVIGRDCNICDHVFVENDVTVGDRVTVKSGVQLWDGVRLDDDVFVGPNATFTNDRYPRSKVYPEKFLQTHVRHGASIGANATILPGLTIGERAMIAAGSVVTRDVPARVLVQGNPGRDTAFLDADHIEAGALDRSKGPYDLLKGASLHAISPKDDQRGALVVAEFDDLPFTPKRFFSLSGVPTGASRGHHAHLRCAQFLMLLSGEVTALVDDGHKRIALRMTSPGDALHIAPGIWGGLLGFAPSTTLAILASDSFDEADYVRDYRTFIRSAGK